MLAAPAIVAKEQSCYRSLFAYFQTGAIKYEVHARASSLDYISSDFESHS
jgi:hypothetical protein